MLKDNLPLKTPSMHVTPNYIFQIIIYTFHLTITSPHKSPAQQSPSPKPWHLRPTCPASNRLLLFITPHIAICTLPPFPSSRLHIPATRTTARQAHMNQPRKNAERCSDPHEHKHLRAKPRTDVQALLTCNDVLEDNEHNRCDNGGSSSEQSGDERPDGEGERPPPRIQYNWSQQDVDKIHTHARQEEAKHKMARNLDQVQNIVDLSW